MSSQELEQALNAAADTLMMPLEIKTNYVLGGATRKSPWGVDMCPVIVESRVYRERSVVALVARVIGNLHLLLISDGKEGKLQLFVLNGAMLGLRDKPAPRMLPDFWTRERIYKSMAKGLKVAYTKTFYAQKWDLKERGTKWLAEYLDLKNADRAGPTITV